MKKPIEKIEIIMDKVDKSGGWTGFPQGTMPIIGEEGAKQITDMLNKMADRINELYDNQRV